MTNFTCSFEVKVGPPDGVIIKVKATGVCRSDWHGWKGHDDDIKTHGIEHGFVPGHEVSGIIVQISKGATKHQIGDRVVVPFILSCGACRECHRSRPTVCEDQTQPGFTMLGSFAEYLAVPRSDRNLCELPENVGFCEAAALGCRFTTAYRAVIQQGQLGSAAIIANDDTSNASSRSTTNTAPTADDDDPDNNNTALLDSSICKSVAIFGAGGLGLSCIMIAKSIDIDSNMQIIAVDVSDQALQKAVELGATHTINVLVHDSSSSSTNNNVQSRIAQMTNGIGVDLAIDAAGFKSTCENAVLCTRRGGRMVQVGLPIGHSSPPIVDMGRVAARELEIVGSHGMAASDMSSVLQLVSSGKLDPKKLVEREVDVEEGAAAIMAMDHGSPVGITMVTSFGVRANGPSRL